MDETDPIKNSSSVKTNKYNSTRQLFNEKILKQTYSFKKLESNNALKSSVHYCTKYYKPSPSCMQGFFFKRFPFFQWIQTYDVKNNLLKDVISGLTIGIVHIPQGMAYSIMAGLPPVYGLYVSFFPVLLYAFLGTSRHLSIGSFAITSLMTFSCIQRFDGKYYSSKSSLGGSNATNYVNGTESNENHVYDNNYLSNDVDEAKVMISMAVTLMAGIIQIIFALLHVGFVTKYLSDVIVKGFTTGAAFHIVLSQVNPLLGITTGKLTTPFKLVENIIEIINNLRKINPPTVYCAIISIVIFVLVKELINEKYKSRMIMPIPMELLLVVFGTLFSYLFDFNGNYKIKIVGNIQRGIPAPRLPPMKIIPDVFGDAIGIAIVSFAVNISMAKLFSKKYKYELSPNQEAFAYGIGNIVTACFKGFPACVALSRSAILDGVGGKTQVFGLVSSALMLIVCLAVGPLFKTLPSPCLAAIIVVALKNMILQLFEFPVILKRSKFEALAWFITFLGVMVFDVDVGLYIGVAATLMLVIFRSQRPRMSVLGNIPSTDIYESIDVCNDAVEIPETKILRFEESIFYANVDNFKYKILKYSDLNINDVISQINKEKSEFSKLIQDRKEIKQKLENLVNTNAAENFAFSHDEASKSIDQVSNQLDERISEIKNKLPIKYIILDCSCINNIDSQGVTAFIQLNDSFKELGVSLHLSFCKPCILKMFKKNKFEESFNYENIYPTTHDAVLSINKQKNQSKNICDETVVQINNEINNLPDQSVLQNQK